MTASRPRRTIPQSYDSTSCQWTERRCCEMPQVALHRNTLQQSFAPGECEMEAVNIHAESQTSEAIGVAIHTREGFVGDVCAMLRPNSVHQYVEVSGPHAPHRVELARLQLPDREDPASLAE